MKYDKHHIDKIKKSLEDGDGRVRACKAAGITYQTFLNWLENEIEFLELVKKAEDCGNDKIEDICKRRIIENTQWQSAAWWLERTKPHKYGANRQTNEEQTGKIIVESDS
jgi:hypothetical protein